MVFGNNRACRSCIGSGRRALQLLHVRAAHRAAKRFDGLADHTKRGQWRSDGCRAKIELEGVWSLDISSIIAPQG
jgi:hypothetical protein